MTSAVARLPNPMHAAHLYAVWLQERPEAVLPTMGGQTALNLAKALSEVRQGMAPMHSCGGWWSGNLVAAAKHAPCLRHA